jgi:hypothetical protein
VGRHCVEKLYTAVVATAPAEWKDGLEAPITETELWQAPRKCPGDDGIPVECYKWGWKVMKGELVAIYNYMFQGTVSKRQKQGAIVCILKKKTPRLVSDY